MSDQPEQAPTSKAIPLGYREDGNAPSASHVDPVEAAPTAGHAFVVTTVVTETVTETETRQEQQPAKGTAAAADRESKAEAEELTSKEEAKAELKEESKQEQPCCSSSAPASPTRAVVPISTSLPSKLLRLHAKRSAQALLHQVEQLQSQAQSLDSQFGSEEGGAGGGDFAGNDCAELFDDEGIAASSSAGPLSPSPQPQPPPPRSSPAEGDEERLVEDVGMGSSIDDSEESEVDDELKPLAVDNHVVAPPPPPPLADDAAAQPGAVAAVAGPEAAVLSEANLEKFRKHHHQHHPHPQPHPHAHHALDNIYLHPNFQYDFEPQSQSSASASPPEMSPPPAVAPANSPTEQRRVHRSFLTMASAKRPSQPDVECERERERDAAESVTSAATTEPPAGGDQSEGGVVNEIDSLDPALVPSAELAAEIAEAVEFYFSNESILKDAFLLKHVRRNKEGFVSLKLVSSFKRVRQLTRDWKVVGHAVRLKSRRVELNDVGTKVRRVDPLPSFDETMPSRTIVACDLPLDKLTIERVSDIFAKCGEIALIRILKPGMAIPVDVRQFMNKYPEMQAKECALVEYVESAAAREAKHLEGPFQVYDMVAPKKKTGKKAPAVIQVAAPVARMVENYRYFNDANYERTRGGSFSGALGGGGGGGVDSGADFRYKLRRNNSDYHTKADGHNYYQQPPAYGLHHSPSHAHAHAHHHHHHAQHPQHPHQPHFQPSFHQHPHLHRGSLGGGGGGGSSEHVHGPAPSYHHQHFQPRGSLGQDSAMSFFALSPRRFSGSSAAAAAAASASASGESGPAAEGHQHQQQHHSSSSNNSSSNNNSSGSGSANTSGNSTAATVGSSGLARRLSNCSDSYSSYSELSRRPSNCSDVAVAAAVASAAPPQRRDSNCSDSCPCARRISDFGQPEAYRKTSQGSIGSGERRFSNGSIQFERSFSNASDQGNGNGSGGGGGNNNNGGVGRRLSNDFHLGECKQSLETQSGLPAYEHDASACVGGGGGGYNVFRRYSNNFHNNVANKLAQYDNAQYINGRRISTDSGYDRRYSFGSEYEGSPRSRTGSFLSNYNNKHCGEFDGSPRSRTGSFLDGSPRSRSGSFAQRNAENLVRTPIGPDGSKGFGSRSRKFGQTVSPVN